MIFLNMKFCLLAVGVFEAELPLTIGGQVSILYVAHLGHFTVNFPVV